MLPHLRNVPQWYALPVLLSLSLGCAPSSDIQAPPSTSSPTGEKETEDKDETEIEMNASREETSRMNLADLESILREFDSELQTNGGAFQLQVANLQVLVLTDTSHDRMRIIAPITRMENVSPEQRAMLLEANFHTALDARYSSSQDVLYSAFIHPLSPLTDEQVSSALRQVVSLALTYGSEYSSGELSFESPQAPVTQQKIPDTI